MYVFCQKIFDISCPVGTQGFFSLCSELILDGIMNSKKSYCKIRRFEPSLCEFWLTVTSVYTPFIRGSCCPSLAVTWSFQIFRHITVRRWRSTYVCSCLRQRKGVHHSVVFVVIFFSLAYYLPAEVI